MAVVLGMSDDIVIDIVTSLKIPSEVSCANFNCPGQVVISGTIKGIEAAKTALLAKGAKRVLGLDVHGAFHSNLMASAEKELARVIENMTFMESSIPIAMNVTGAFASSLTDIKKLLVKQLTSSVRWAECVRTIDNLQPTCFIEIGCGTTLQGMNKRIGPKGLTFSIEKTKDIEQLLELLS
jgi:[acyl-carrier-protein] S-malonyltransferase